MLTHIAWYLQCPADRHADNRHVCTALASAVWASRVQRRSGRYRCTKHLRVARVSLNADAILWLKVAASCVKMCRHDVIMIRAAAREAGLNVKLFFFLKAEKSCLARAVLLLSAQAERNSLQNLPVAVTWSRVGASMT